MVGENLGFPTFINVNLFIENIYLTIFGKYFSEKKIEEFFILKNYLYFYSIIIKTYVSILKTCYNKHKQTQTQTYSK